MDSKSGVKMKTKKVEKTYYVDNGCMILFKGEYGIRFNEWTSLRTEPDLTHCHKITISWEEQEKKVTIAECRGDEDCDHCEAVRVCSPCQLERDIIEDMKKEITVLKEEVSKLDEMLNASVCNANKLNEDYVNLKEENAKLIAERAQIDISHRELIELRKENENLKRYMATPSYEMAIEIQRLKDLVNRAKPWVAYEEAVYYYQYCEREEMKKWLKEAEEIGG